MAVKKNNDKRASLRRGIERSWEHKDDGAGTGVLKLPQGVSFVKWEKDVKYRHLIIAFQAGENHPLVKSGDFNKGDYVSSVEIYLHKGLGVEGKKSVICMKSTYGKKCAVCDHAEKLRNDGRSELADQLKPKKQVIYIIYDVKEKKKEFKVLSAPHFCFEKGLVEAARTASDEDKGFVEYPYLDGEGAVVRYMIKEDSFKNRKFLTLADGTSFKEITKDDDLPTDFLDKPFCLDDCIVIPSYEDVQKIIFQDDDDDEDGDEDDKKPGKDDDDEDDEDEKPKAKRKKDDEDENEKQEKCPHDMEFGVDTGKDEVCDDCNLYTECRKKKKEKGKGK